MWWSPKRRSESGALTQRDLQPLFMEIGGLKSRCDLHDAARARLDDAEREARLARSELQQAQQTIASMGEALKALAQRMTLLDRELSRLATLGLDESLRDIGAERESLREHNPGVLIG